MKVQKFVLVAIGIYQLARFFVLALVILLQDPVIGDSVLRNAIMGLSSGALIGAVLVLQYVLTGHPILIIPLRLVKLLDLVGSVLLFLSLFFGDPSLSRRIAFQGTASIVLFTDTIVFIFLLLLSPKRVTHHNAEDHDTKEL